MISKDDPIVIVSAIRTPFGHFNGYFKQFSAIQLGSAALKAAIETAKLQSSDIQEVLMGCVLPAGLGQAGAQQVAISTGIPFSVHCVTQRHRSIILKLNNLHQCNKFVL